MKENIMLFFKVLTSKYNILGKNCHLRKSSSWEYRKRTRQRRATTSAWQSLRAKPCSLRCFPLMHLVPVDTQMTSACSTSSPIEETAAAGVKPSTTGVFERFIRLLQTKHWKILIFVLFSIKKTSPFQNSLETSSMSWIQFILWTLLEGFVPLLKYGAIRTVKKRLPSYVGSKPSSYDDITLTRSRSQIRSKTYLLSWQLPPELSAERAETWSCPTVGWTFGGPDERRRPPGPERPEPMTVKRPRRIKAWQKFKIKSIKTIIQIHTLVRAESKWNKNKTKYFLNYIWDIQYFSWICRRQKKKDLFWQSFVLKSAADPFIFFPLIISRNLSE